MAIWCTLLLWQQVRTEKRREVESAAIAVVEKEQDLPRMQGHESADMKV